MTCELSISGLTLAAFLCLSVACEPNNIGPNNHVGEAAPSQGTSAATYDYVGRGLPSASHPWSPKDFATAVQTLKSIAEADSGLLPRYLGPGNSGEMFARIVHPENLSKLNDKSLPMHQRMPSAIAFLTTAKTSILLYFRASTSERFYGDELLELQAYALVVARDISGLTDEFLSTFDPQDPTYATRLAGLTQLKQGLGNMLLAAIVTLGEVSRYGEAALIRFAGKLRSTAPTIRAGLPRDIGLQVEQRLDELLIEPMSQRRRKSLAELREALHREASK